MTTAHATLVALSLLINNITYLYDKSVIEDTLCKTKLVFILSICLFLYEIPILPRYFWNKNTPISFLIEVAISLAVLEYSLIYIWKFLEDYVLLYSDDILVQLANFPSLEWVYCNVCCGKSDCSVTFAQLLLKSLSFMLMMAICVISFSK
ncbi:PREDICTED: uncharacterized protein LOC106103123 [Papilio polytes]|uniref:uncharacterized protein LOC106103123 n=1 Tax=Papilio polytes TaxID=76194 RepID=UPI0006769FF7|nr:PREDICTED: uncharacterized protein LOC106103123 [Papilio polytes]